MSAEEILVQAKELITPTKSEESKIIKLVEEIIKKSNYQLKKGKIAAKTIVGGSIAKGTWLPGISDIDFFLLFNYPEYKDKSAQLSDFTERILKKVFKKIVRLHGSRDYFSLNYKNFYLEFVPVLEIKNANEAKNITDFSPLHAEWVKNKIMGNKQLQSEIRLAKQFFKSAGVYGAESYISGFSGHAIEILTIYYRGLLSLLKNAIKWRERLIVDIEKRFKNEKDVFETLSKSKLQSPIILIDPVEPKRNALAALNQENFFQLKDLARSFLSKPELEFFKPKKFSIENLIKAKGHRKLIILQAKPEKGKPDVVGCKLLNKFKKIKSEFVKNDFKIFESGWYWDKKNQVIFWFYFPNIKLEKTKLHIGPPIKFEKFAKEFRKKWKKVKVKEGMLVTEIKRKYTMPEQLTKDLSRIYKFSKFKIY